MRWDGFFQDLEDQLAAERDAERAALDSETERLRVANLTLRERLKRLEGGGARHPSFELVDGTVLSTAIVAVGADWMVLDGEGAPRRASLVPLSAIASIGMPQHDRDRSIDPLIARGSDLRTRMTFGYVLRDLGRRRAGVAVHLAHGRALTGTIDRAGADHLDLALHDPDAPRRTAEVTGYRTVPFASIAWVGIAGAITI